MDHHSQQGRVAKSFVTMMVVLVVSLALQVAGFITPGWFVVKYGEGTWREAKLGFGLWFSKYCVHGDCVDYDLTKPDGGIGVRSYLSFNMLEYQMRSGIALVLLLIALLVCGCIRTRSWRQPAHMQFGLFCIVFFTLISGFLAMTAACKFGRKVSDINNIPKMFGDGRIVFPYSIILTGSGGLFANLLSLFILFSVPCENYSVSPSSARPVFVIFPGQPQHGYMYKDRLSVTLAGQTQPGYVYKDQLSVTHAGQPQPVYVYTGQPSVTHAGQPQPGYVYTGQPSVTHAGQPQPGYI